MSSLRQDRVRYPLLLKVTLLWTALGCLLTLLIPRSTPLVLLAATIAPALWSRLDPAAERTAGSMPITITVFLLSGLYLVANSFVAFNLRDALFTAVTYLVFVAATLVTLQRLGATSADALHAMGVGFIAATALAALVLCFEFFSEHVIFEAVLANAPWTLIDPKHLREEGPFVQLAGAYLLNRNTSLLALLFWPCMLVGHTLLWVGWRRLALTAFIGIIVLAILKSEHETSKLALVASAALFLVFPLQPRLFLALIAAGWVAVNALCVPLAAVAFAGKLYLAPGLPESVAPRLIIWGNVSRKVVNRPILGVGIGTPRWREEHWPPVEGEYRNLTTSPHSHNIFLQAWYELGILGALALCAAGLAVLRAIGSLPAGVQRFLLPGFVAFTAIGAASFSLWQAWFLAGVGLAIVFGRLGVELVRHEPRRQTA
jgi:O-antigen ligase